MTRGVVHFGPDIDPARLAERLADALRNVQARDIAATPARVSFTGGIFRLVSNWNLLVPFTRGELIIDAPGGRLEYRVSFRQLIVLLLALSAAVLATTLVWQPPAVVVVALLGLVWLWLGGLNILLGTARFRRFLRQTIESAGGREARRAAAQG